MESNASVDGPDKVQAGGPPVRPSDSFDIFVSYAHDDNWNGYSGWVTALQKELTIRVTQLTGQRPRVLFDEKNMRGNDPVESLIDRVKAARVLLPVLSPCYLESEWCKKELEAFLEAGARRRSLDGMPIFKCIKTPIPLDTHPAEIRSLIGYEFTMPDPKRPDKKREINPLKDRAAMAEFYYLVDDLAHDVADILRQINEGTHRDPAAPVVYLAETSFDVKPAYERIKRDLRQHGYIVLPDRRLPMRADDLKKFVQDQLKRCRVSVHILGGMRAIVPEGSNASIVELQNNLAIERGEHSEESFRFLWIPPDLQHVESEQRDLMDRIRSDPRMGKNADLLEGPVEMLKHAVHEKLRELYGGTERTKIVYLICHESDFLAAKGIAQYLHMNRGYDFRMFPTTGAEEDVARVHYENLQRCDAALLYYGAAPDTWFQDRQTELREVEQVGKPMKCVTAIFLAPPETPGKEILDFQSTKVVRLPLELSDDVLEDALQPLLAELEPARIQAHQQG